MDLHRTHDCQPPSAGPPPRPPWRALAIGAALIPLNCLWMTHVEYVRYSDNVSTSALFFNAVCLLMLMLVVIVVARIRAEVGLPTMELYQVGADEVLRAVGGDMAWTRSERVAMTLFFWMSRTHRQFPMSSQVDALRIGDRAGIRAGHVAAGLLLASVLATVFGFWSYLHEMYQVGYESGKYNPIILRAFGEEPWLKLERAVVSPQGPDAGRAGGYLFGLLFTLFLSAMRARFPGWPLHPAGFLVYGSMGIARIWVPVFIAWTVKALLLRYGGLTAHNRAIPFFIGLVAGEFAVGMAVTLLGLAGVPLPPESGIGGL